MSLKPNTWLEETPVKDKIFGPVFRENSLRGITHDSGNVGLSPLGSWKQSMGHQVL